MVSRPHSFDIDERWIKIFISTHPFVGEGEQIIRRRRKGDVTVSTHQSYLLYARSFGLYDRPGNVFF